MPVYAALTHNGDPPQMEFIPTDSTHKYPKLTGESLVFKFANKAIMDGAQHYARLERGFGLFKVTGRDLRTGSKEQAIRCETPDDFTEALNLVVWCKKCNHFTYSRFMNRKCWRCKRQL